jgi:hypothetical protein
MVSVQAEPIKESMDAPKRRAVSGLPVSDSTTPVTVTVTGLAWALVAVQSRQMKTDEPMAVRTNRRHPAVEVRKKRSIQNVR